MVIRIYWASVTGNRKIEGDQTRVRYLIESLKISSEWIDITTDASVKKKMREECGNPTAMPPQIFSEDRYLGDVSDMEEYVEQERILEWFGLSDGNNVANDQNTSDTQQSYEVISHDAIHGDVTRVDGRLQSSPTSSVENEPPVVVSKPPSSESKIHGIDKKSDKDLPSRKNVLATAGAFESFSIQPQTYEAKPKVIFSQSKSLNTSSSENMNTIDDERRRRILGLSAAENSQTSIASVTLQPNTNDEKKVQPNANEVTVVADR